VLPSSPLATRSTAPFGLVASGTPTGAVVPVRLVPFLHALPASWHDEVGRLSERPVGLIVAVALVVILLALVMVVTPGHQIFPSSSN
jgi:hypothetical protein